MSQKYKPGHERFPNYSPLSTTYDINLPPHYFDFLIFKTCDFCKIEGKIKLIHMGLSEDDLSICRSCYEESRKECLCHDCFEEWIKNNISVVCRVGIKE